MGFHRISRENGLWQKLLLQWEEQCSLYGESLDDYAVASIPTVRPLAEEAQVKTAGVYGLEDESGYIALCQLNVGYIPGYADKVLRVRHAVFSPRFDFDEAVTIDQYVDVVAGVLGGVLDMSDGEMSAPNVKFHFRSLLERQFFDAYREVAVQHGAFGSINVKGAWLYIGKLQG